MAVFSFLVSSVFGMVSGLTCWLFFSYTPLAAFGLYLSLSIVVGMALIIAGMLAMQTPADRLSA